jgi:large subunit ribosomal protein L34
VRAQLTRLIRRTTTTSPRIHGQSPKPRTFDMNTQISRTITTITRKSPIQTRLFSTSILTSTSTRTPSLLLSTPSVSPSTTSYIRSFSSSSPLLAKRNTYNPSRRVQKRRHGFLARMKTRAGRTIIHRRRAKGRKGLSW